MASYQVYWRRRSTVTVVPAASAGHVSAAREGLDTPRGGNRHQGSDMSRMK